ncbi:MAG TPA: integration host factor, actinobacterial type [Jatrophihabitans sp.]|nr:integration host factor, actinobacterial type [Jatrophihabitans sp.]
MPGPPRLTAEQRAAARGEALLARQARAAVKARLKSGQLSLSGFLLLAEQDPRLAALRVPELLAALPGIGDAGASRLLAELRIAGSRRVQGLGPKQRAALLARLDHPAQSSP